MLSLQEANEKRMLYNEGSLKNVRLEGDEKTNWEPAQVRIDFLKEVSASCAGTAGVKRP